jgi:hypothetical protein
MVIDPRSPYVKGTAGGASVPSGQNFIQLRKSISQVGTANALNPDFAIRMVIQMNRYQSGGQVRLFHLREYGRADSLVRAKATFEHAEALLTITAKE